MSTLYGNTADYQTQLRKLEKYCTDNPNDAAAYFVLAYQYLVIDAKDAAVDVLKVVVKNQPQDSTAKRMLDALAPAAAPTATAACAHTGGSRAGNGVLEDRWARNRSGRQLARQGRRYHDRSR